MVRDIDRQRARMVILEIIRQCGGELKNKTNLFKAFWKAHVSSAAAGRSLTHYPIVKMPNGPGIDDFDGLLGELLSDGLLTTDVEPSGQYASFVFQLTPKGDCAPHSLSRADQDAIAEGVRFVLGRTASSVSHDSHTESRSWKAARVGQEIDVVLDAIPDDEFSERNARLAEISSLVDRELFARSPAS